MKITQLTLGPFQTNCYVLEDSGESIIIDPGEMSPSLQDITKETNVQVIVNTHGHCDHCGGNAALVEQTGAPLALHPADSVLLEHIAEQGALLGISCPPSPPPSKLLEAGDTLQVGTCTLNVYHVPGHTPGHIALKGEGFLFSGDTLFAGSIGRTDLPGGNQEQLFQSLQEYLLSFPDDTIVYPGHGPSTSIGIERKTNPFLSSL